MLLGPIVALGGIIWMADQTLSEQRNKEKIESEFKRRDVSRITIAGNTLITGSVFYPIVPNPKALAIDYKIGSTSDALEVPLGSVSSIHMADRKAQQVIAKEQPTDNPLVKIKAWIHEQTK